MGKYVYISRSISFVSRAALPELNGIVSAVQVKAGDGVRATGSE